MASKVTIPNQFATATTAIPLGQLDANFSNVNAAINNALTYSNYAVDTGIADNYSITISGQTTSYAAGLVFQFKAANTNTGASTLNVNGQGTQAIKNLDGSALSAGQIVAGAVATVVYDGTNFQLTSGVQSAFGNVTIATATITNLSSSNATITGGSFANGTFTNANIASGNVTVTIVQDQYGNVRAIPDVGSKGTAYTLAKADNGRYVQLTTGGSINIVNNVFADGDVVSIFNNTNANANIVCTIDTAYISGTDADKASVVLATRGLATVLFVSANTCVISGNVS